VTEAHVVILLAGGLCAVACALLGTFLVLRRMALLGDAISHAVLPGIVVAFLLTNSRAALPVVVGAGALGLLTVFLIELLHRTRRVKEDASIAVIFPALFAVGVLLVTQYAGQTDLDAECVLYGEIAFAPEMTMTLAGAEVSRPLVTLGLVALANLAFVLLLFKELKLATFDGALAATLGISPVVVHYLLMGMVSLTTVASFESVGAILVVAFLVVPAAAAHLLTDRLGRMLLIAALIGAGSSTAGYFAARALDASIAGAMATTMGLVFALVWMFAPREGLVAARLRRRHRRTRFARALLVERLGHAPAAPETLARDLAWPRGRVDEVVALLVERGLVERRDGLLHTNVAGHRFVEAVVG
jgi:manganese/zinc/iron transport system permease protein